MTDTDDRLDLSILAQVEPKPEPDEKPDTRGTAPAGKAVDEEPPPRRRQRRNATPTAEPGPRVFTREDEGITLEYKPGIFVKPITEAYMTMAAIVMPLSQPIGTSIMQNAENCAKAWDNAAKVDKRVRKYLLQAMSTGVLLPLLIAHMPIASVVFFVLFPPKPREQVESTPPGPTGETINPVSNGYTRR
jgi:hypothetical protein